MSRGQMVQVGKNESDDICFWNESQGTWDIVLLLLFQWENKNIDLITTGYLMFGI